MKEMREIMVIKSDEKQSRLILVDSSAEEILIDIFRIIKYKRKKPRKVERVVIDDKEIIIVPGTPIIMQNFNWLDYVKLAEVLSKDNDLKEARLRTAISRT